jgi:hypothetical protein
MPQSIHERQRKIRDRVESMSVTRPDDPDEGFWYGVRDDPNYYRYTRDDVDVEGPLYDVYLETETRRDKLGNLKVTIGVYLFNCRAQYIAGGEDVYSATFDGHQPTEQAFLLNAHHYERQAQEIFNDFVEEVEYWAETDPELPEIPE